MNNGLKTFTRLAVIGLIVGVVIVCVVLKSAFNAVSGMILDGIGNNPIINITDDGVNIADMIIVDGSGVSIGGSRVDLSEIGDTISSGLESSGIIVSDNMSGSVGRADVTASGFTQNRYTFPADINRALDIDVDNCDVVIATSDSESIVIDVFENDELTYNFSTSDNTLMIRDTTKAGEEKYLNLLGFKISLGTEKKQNVYTGLAMIIYLPEGFNGEIELETSNGDVKLGNLKLTESLNIDTTSGNVELSNIEAYDIRVKTSDGRLTFNNLSAIEITAATSNGRAVVNETTSKRLEVTTTNAAIDFTRLFGEKFTFRTNNGDISGSILGQELLFSIITETDRSAFPKTSENDRAQYKLDAKTSGGDINVRFVE
ncbi:MAG: DUF4097 domain-containing protein [Clostridiales bacterium]|nr:DUF4097 domain-containing protein [Clostridiales bacterium]